MNEYGIHDTDTGSLSVQIALLTKRINELTAHLKTHPKDNHSRRGLLMLVGKRRRFLRHLEHDDAKTFAALTKKLGLA